MHKATLHAVHFFFVASRVHGASADYVYIEISFSVTQHSAVPLTKSMCGKTNVKKREKNKGREANCA